MVNVGNNEVIISFLSEILIYTFFRKAIDIFLEKEYITQSIISERWMYGLIKLNRIRIGLSELFRFVCKLIFSSIFPR